MDETMKLIVKLAKEGWFSKKLERRILDAVCEKYGSEFVAEWIVKNAPNVFR